MLEARALSKGYATGLWRSSVTPVFSDVSLHLVPGKTLGLVGPSGCGKSTLARVLLRLIPPDQGSLWFDGREITHLSGKSLLFFRRRVQFLSQHPHTFFNPAYTMKHSLLEALRLLGDGSPAATFNQLTAEASLAPLLEQMQLRPALLSRYPHQLSGGELQRLALCRALLPQPRVLILDEATSMLDVSVQSQILHLLKDLQVQRQLAYLFISHDHEVVRWMSDEVMSMSSTGSASLVALV
ncbi:ABC transporter ATP-binding protein [Anoxynatronum buryatiense]|uniref:Peptide/nickel transport system ATP-binding protein n=1 Tax=Anoxynatronum buryatiense TaxID=489973 RepID=A0AA45WUZ2_9CLOT|nr:dipeptide/oligopeptide/nickel ABC transporter ATP-binding protein [Anoxynatronum buryatiense]SMP51072.1 peptide/nickel transport system ATP-binding protein [Anoxynatronum buryatiense]